MPNVERKRPYTAFNFLVEWGGASIGFSEVTGLTADGEAADYRQGSAPAKSVEKMPGLRKYSSVTLKRGVTTGGNAFLKWLSGARTARGERRDLVVTLLDETGKRKAKWKVRNCYPVKVTGPALEAKGNEVAIEELELAHEGIEVDKD